MSKVILYDIPSKDKTPWSLNPWKTRMILNYKGIDYTTQWVEYPDIAPLFKSFGLPPNDKDAPGYFADYTSPAIRYEDGIHQMDSWPIAHELEKRYPSPTLHLDDPIVEKIRHHTVTLFMPIRNHYLPKAPAFLGKPSADYFHATRSEKAGMPLAQMEKELAKEEDWVEAGKAANEAGDLLRKSGGPYFLGETVSYADFILVSMLHMLKTVHEPFFQRFLTLEPAFEKLYNACTQWLERID